MSLEAEKAMDELVARATQRFGVMRLPRRPADYADFLLARIDYYENLAIQAEQLLRANGIVPAYSSLLSPAYLNEH